MKRRVVVTGLGVVSPLAWGVEPTWKAILAGKSGANRITAFDPTDYACQIACEVPRIDGRGGGADKSDHPFDPDQAMSPKDQRRVDDFILYAMAAADEAVRDSGWVPQTEEDRRRTGVNIGSGIGGLSTIADTALELQEKGPRRISPLLHPLGADQSRVGPGLDPPRLQGTEPLGGHRLRHRRPRGRRRHALHPVRRRRRDGRRRRRGGDLQDRHRRLHRLPRHEHPLQRRADPRLASLRQGPRRLRHGRGRRRAGAGGAGARQGARREDLRRGDGLRPGRRRLSHHRSGRGRRRRLPRHGGGASPTPGSSRPTSTTSTPTAPRRRSATRSSWARSSGCSARPPARRR